MTTTGAGNRTKGHNAEREIVRWLRDHGWPDATTTRNTGGAGGRQVGDISFEPGVALEVKNVGATAWPTWLRQAEQAAGPDRIAAVVRRTPRIVDPGRWVTVARVTPELWHAAFNAGNVTIVARQICNYGIELVKAETPFARPAWIHHARPFADWSETYLACRFETFAAALHDHPSTV